AGWNTVRSVVWVGLIHAILALAALLLTTPSFWDITLNPDRNFELFFQFTTSMITALLALPSALVTAFFVKRLGQQAEAAIPTVIETRCECGAVFKSKPMICSECGKYLSEP
ncbi:MAG: hypothetical protein ACFFEE_09175, partial [Candidatus Thorarchaeota archaeon]